MAVASVHSLPHTSHPNPAASSIPLSGSSPAMQLRSMLLEARYPGLPLLDSASKPGKRNPRTAATAAAPTAIAAPAAAAILLSSLLSCCKRVLLALQCILQCLPGGILQHRCKCS